MYFHRFYDSDLAQASYLLGCQQSGEAIVIDPVRDVQRYLDHATQAGLKIVAVSETHIHADFLSGSRELAARTGATLFLSDEGGPEWSYAFPHEGLRDGRDLRLGNVVLRAVHTPGHTPEHLSFLVTDVARAAQPVMALTGDFVFVGDVGRPDLLDEVAGGQDTRLLGARQLFTSLREKFLTLPDDVQVWPGHGSGSACGKALGAVGSTTVGYERKFAWWAPALAQDHLEGFTRSLLEGQPDAPSYYGRMKRHNRLGPAVLGIVKPLEPLAIDDLERALDRGARLLDTRPRDEYQAASVPGSLHLPGGKTFETWAGWLLDPETEYVLFARSRGQAEDLRRRLWMTGIDRVVGYIGTFEHLFLEPHLPAPVSELGDLSQTFVLDVRARSEYEAGHLPNATQIHAGRLFQNLNRIPRDTRVVVHCQGGARSAAAASLLRAEGFDVLDLAGGYDAWAKTQQQDGSA